MPQQPDVSVTKPSLSLRRPPTWLVHAALLLVQLLFGVNYVAAKVALREISPLGFVFFRVWGTAAILGTALLSRPGRPAAPRLRSRDYWQLFIYGLLGISINQTAFLEGLARSSATNASIILVTIPVVTLAFAVFLKRERATAADLAGITLGLAGALVIILPRGGMTLSSSAMLGNVLLLVCSAAYSLFLVLTREIVARHDALVVATWMFLFAGFTIAPIGYPGVRDAVVAGMTPVGWASVGFVTIGATAVPYLLNTWALATAKSSTVAIYVLLQPVVAAILGRLLLGETFGTMAALAVVMIVAGVLVSAWGHAPAPATGAGA
ncbi:MAG: DMT family transporter [Gemmatimonadaceae bacterium]|nr:DMT family transporter [Gemmatimonadaceae bacterium]